MGITKKDSQFLFHSKALGVHFTKTLTLGRLQLYVTKSEIESQLIKNSIEKRVDEFDFVDEYAEPLFKILGAAQIESLDYSNYENATIIHDLNQPIPKILESKFTCVVDGGTIEHVFNFPAAIKNCMDALEVGGHYIGMSPGNNQMGHGFYQFSPELYFRVFSKENGFEVKKILITTTGNEDEWYEVEDPVRAKSRVMLINNCPVTIMIVAQKISEKKVFEQSPLQSDYFATWQTSQSYKEPFILGGKNRFKRIYRIIIPKGIRNLLRNVYDLYKTSKIDTQNFGTLNPDHFKKTTI